MGFSHCKTLKSFYTEKGNNYQRKLQNGGEYLWILIDLSRD